MLKPFVKILKVVVGEPGLETLQRGIMLRELNRRIAKIFGQQLTWLVLWVLTP